MSSRRPKRPAPFAVGRVRVRVKRGPDAENRWYWRADRPTGDGRRVDVWSGWGHRDEAEAAILVELTKTGQHPVDGSIRTIRDLLECWAAAHVAREDIRPSSRVAAKTSAKRIARSELGHVLVDRLGRHALEQHRDAELRRVIRRTREDEDGNTVVVSERTVAGSTVARDLKVLAQAWAWAVECGHIERRELPAVQVKRRDRVYSDYTPTRAEIGQLLEGAGERCRRALVLLACTGARIGEVASLTWSKVSDDCSTVVLDGKTGARAFPLHPTVQSELQRWPRGEPDERVTGYAVSSCKTKVERHLTARSAELGIPRVSPNGMRRAMTDALYNSGALPDVEAALLGHSPQTAMLHYRKAREEHLARAVIRSGVALPSPEGEVIDLAQRLAQVSGGGSG